jgi:tRNA G10  N-methylase Trm11
MINKYFKYYILILFFSFSINISAQEPLSIDGIWHCFLSGYEEHLGHFELKAVLTIKNGKYIWIEERISESMYWSSGEKGSIIINNYDIIFNQEKRTFDQFELRWEIEHKIHEYTYSINNNVLILFQNNIEKFLFKKEK